MPGPQTEPVDRSLLETAMSGAVNMINNTPYTSAGINTFLFAPADTLTPWKGINPSVQELPDSRLKTMAEARRIMVVKHEKMREILEEDIRLEVNRYRSGKLKLGHNKSETHVSVGGI